MRDEEEVVARGDMEGEGGEEKGDGEEGDGGEGDPSSRTAPPTRDWGALFILSQDSEEKSVKMSICLENSGNRAITVVNERSQLSSCSREACQQ